MKALTLQPPRTGTIDGIDSTASMLCIDGKPILLLALPPDPTRLLDGTPPTPSKRKRTPKPPTPARPPGSVRYARRR